MTAGTPGDTPRHDENIPGPMSTPDKTEIVEPRAS